MMSEKRFCWTSGTTHFFVDSINNNGLRNLIVSINQGFSKLQSKVILCSREFVSLRACFSSAFWRRTWCARSICCPRIIGIDRHGTFGSWFWRLDTSKRWTGILGCHLFKCHPVPPFRLSCILCQTLSFCLVDF